MNHSGIYHPQIVNSRLQKIAKDGDLIRDLDSAGYSVIPDFYKNPELVRESFLNSRFEKINPDRVYFSSALRTSFNVTLLETVAYLLRQDIFDAIDEGLTTNSAILGFEDVNEINLIHSDPFMYAGILYLSPNPPPNSGTSFFEDKRIGIRRRNHFSDCNDLRYNTPLNFVSKEDQDFFLTWKKIKNRFNSLLLYDARLFHASTGFF